MFKRYRRLELRRVSYAEGNTLLLISENLPEPQRWQLAEEENYNINPGTVWLERRERIVM